ncbi:MAG: outer membrane protein assembly factor BamA, partial [Candidatus Competibacterales bacterium]|nr:outer membrane protein assembly factor BamA [Candidatus Competibacterales bacterium]
ITEGGRYTITDIGLSGDLIVPKDELRALIDIEPGASFSRTRVGAAAQALVDRLGRDGYAFASVNPVPEVDESAREVALNFVVDPGERVYVRRINFSGNLKTQDPVLRREMRQAEGGWFSTEDIERSQTRLQRLKYLSGVSIESEPVPGTTDQVDLEVQVEERPAGSVTFGVGYGQTEGFLLNAGVTQDNFLGTGNEIGFAFNNSDADTLYSLSYNNPYYTPDGVSRGFRINYEETDADELNTADYLIDRLDGQLNYGFPFNETDTLRVGIGVEQLDIKTTDDSPPEIIDTLERDGDEYFNYTLVSSFARDSRNRLIFPSRGSLDRVSAETALPGSEAEYYKISYRHQSYFPFTRTLTFSVRGFLGYGDSFSGDDGLPFWERYFAGGLRSVRGYKTNTLGPRFSNDEPRGGDLLLIGGTELISPIPFLQDSENFRVSAFFDAGNVFDSSDTFDAGELRYSVGLSFTWISPLGPLAFSLAQPLNEQEGDETETFQFSVGVPF